MADKNNNASFDYKQYVQWAEESKTAPLPRKQIDLGGKKIEVFALPGYKDHVGRYIYSGTSATSAVNKDEYSIRRFLKSKSPLALIYKGFNVGTFAVENSRGQITGYLSQMVFDYWVDQISKKNFEAIALVSALGSTSLDLLADSQFGVNRFIGEYERLIQDRLFTKEAVFN